MWSHFALALLVACAAATVNASVYECRNGGTPIYNLTTHTIDQPINDTLARSYTITFGAYHYIVIAGGQTNNQVTLLDIEQGTVSLLGTMSTPRAINVPVVGQAGIVNEATGTMIITGGTYNGAKVRTVDVYNFFTRGWSTSRLSLADLDGPTQCFLVNGKFYVLLTAQKTLDMFDGTTGRWDGSINVGYPPAAASQTHQFGASVGDAIYFTAGVDGPQVNYMVVYNATTNTTGLIYVPFPAGYYLDYFSAYGHRLVFIRDPSNAALSGVIYDLTTNQTTIAALPSSLTSGSLFQAIGGTTHGFYSMQAAWSAEPVLIQFANATTSFSLISEIYTPNRQIATLAYNAKYGAFAVVDGRTGPNDEYTLSKAINLYQESDMTLMTSLTFNQTLCTCAPGYTGFLCGTSGSMPRSVPVSIALLALLCFVVSALRF